MTRLHRYHRAGNLVLAVGVVGGLVAHAWRLAPAWAGFLAAALPASILLAAVQAYQDHHRERSRP